MVPTSTKKPADKKPEPVKPANLENYKKAINLGKELSKNPDKTKADVSREMFPLIQDEKREVIAKAFIEGAGLTEKGAMTYVYNVRQWIKKQKTQKNIRS